MVRFRMIKASIEQFALLANNIADPAKLNVRINLSCGYSVENRNFAVRIKFDGIEDDRCDFILELACVFRFETDADFRKGRDIVISKDLVAHLVMHAVGTARGVLICKMEGTSFAPYILPAIDVTKIVTSDFVIKGTERPREAGE